MSFFERLQAATRHSLLCVGLDPDPAKFPGAWQGDASRIEDFCRAIVDATHDLAAAFKPQIAYFAAQGAEDQLERVIAYIRQVAPQLPIVLDAKRGDIGATAEMYAREAFVRYGADAVTLSPYMGYDTIEPYLDYADRGVFVLCRTSNPGGDDWQMRPLADVEGQPRLFEELARRAQHEWARIPGQIGLVVGATYPAEIARVRALAPTVPLLIPGVGAQGGDAEATVRAGWRADAPILVNSSRAILYAGKTVEGLGAAARAVAQRTQAELAQARG
ncbi:orotidine-5'-phosphate decarboxylase [Inhella proteolytica]|uniref:Orotidine 5'-phosphate decarboxylase n=1 Tax=Inhella proteolytica TaxID=2795029 RepID=A0A931J6J0_9BURK|nr:orotidine-5'-phosphate decarboxylase [Inhella proteolytica]MBH9578459.1 orotidine-5'-phosphate decarboxylase [Inhella proteolytica]